jgi:general secretion pathway protein C
MTACGGARVDTAEQIEETSITPEQATAAAAPAEQTTEAKVAPPIPSGAISRRDLHQVLAAGPAGVLAMVQTEPAREGKQFIGFRITAFNKGAPQAIDIRAGDVLVAINGKKIVTPDDYFRVFQELSVASELRFELLRDGKPETLSYPIVD